jgi:TolB-like protein
MATSAPQLRGNMTIQSRSRWIALVLGAGFLLAGASWIEWYHHRASTGNRSKPDDRTILVLPFRSPNRQAQVELGVGLADRVQAALTASHQLTVRSWDLGSSSTPLLFTEAPIDEVVVAAGRQRRAGYVLLGQFEQLGTRTEIAVRLLRVRDGNPVWSGTYWRGPDGMTAFPSELALDVAEALRLPSSTGRATPNRPAQMPTP